MMKVYNNAKRLWLLISCVLLIQAISAATFEEAACGEYYSFDKMEFPQFVPSQTSYKAGANVTAFYNMTNAYPIPLADMEVIALVLYRGENNTDRVEGDDIRERIEVADEIDLRPNKSYSGKFSWHIPSNAKSGVYVINLYVMQKEKFNIAGLNFHTAIPAASTTFRVNGTDTSFRLNKKETTFNGEPYEFRGFLPILEPGDSANIVTILQGEGNATITRELYRWDIAKKSNRIRKSPPKTFEAGDPITLNATRLEEGVYVARFMAQKDNRQSELWVRFAVRGTVGRLINTGIDTMPIEKGENATAFVCYSNSAASPHSNVNFTGSIKMRVTDATGTVITEANTEPMQITPRVDAQKITFTPNKRLSEVTVESKLFEESRPVDSTTLEYDMSDFENIATHLSFTEISKENNILSYTLTYKTAAGDPAEGTVVLYVVDEDGAAITSDTIAIDGRYRGDLVLEEMPDAYYITAVVQGEEIATRYSSQNITAAHDSQTPQSGTEQGSSANQLPWVEIGIGIGVVLLAAFVFFTSVQRES